MRVVSRRFGRVRSATGACLATLLLAALTGCALPQTRQVLAALPPPGSPLPLSAELEAVPFFPQKAYQCGPAALATVLGAAGFAVTPDELTPEVYLPRRRGSLPLELLAAARRHGAVPYVLRPRLETVLDEVRAGHPVLILQNLGLSFAPVWHYAVVVGFDLERARVVLRSGHERRRWMSLRTFEYTWRRGDYWAVVVSSPDKIPQTAEEVPYLQTVLALEQPGHWQDAATAYDAALLRWPQSLGAAMGLGNSRYALGDLSGAEAVFRAATLAHPEAGVAFNNLAQTLADQSRLTEAEAAARQAVALGGQNSDPNADVFQQTLGEILGR